MLVKDLYKILDEIAPFDNAEDFDNVGLIIGSMTESVKSICLALDCTLDVVDYAVKNKCNVIISHHPLIFNPMKNIDYSDPKGAIIKKVVSNNINVIAMHTNFDAEEKGTAFALAKLLGFTNIYETNADKYLRIAHLEEPMAAGELNEYISRKLNFPSRIYGDENKIINDVGISPGSADENYHVAIEYQADAFIVGEAKHHNIIDACQRGLVFIENGHYANEFPLMLRLKKLLKKELDLEIFVYDKDVFKLISE